MGFGEAIIAMVAVILVLNAFSVSIVGMGWSSHPQRMPVLDPDGIRAVDGTVSWDVHDDLERYMSLHDVNGVSVEVRIPGDLLEGATYTIGDVRGVPHTSKTLSMLDLGNGAFVPMVVRVMVYT